MMAIPKLWLMSFSALFMSSVVGFMFVLSWFHFSSSLQDQLRQLEQHNPIHSALMQYVLDQDEPDHKDVFNERHLEGSGKLLSHQDVVDMYPKEEPIPNPIPADGHDTMSACLLVMDDNHRLAEWMAYHYHVMPLRYLIVAVDPRSRSSPTAILNQWRQQGMYIVEWTDTQFWRTDLRELPATADLQMKRDRHRGRQKFFYRSCLIAMKQAERSWVTLHDTDEYLVYNHAGGDRHDEWERVQDKRHRLNHPGKKRIPLSAPPPTTAEEGAMIQYIRREQDAGHPFFQSPCIGIPRLQFGASESAKYQKQKDVPQFFDADRFDTLHWRRHAIRNDFVKNALGKVMIDVSRVNMVKTPYFMSLHRPIKSICPPPWHNDWESGLRINHYLGSWESYSFRDDSRRGNERSREQWEYKGQEAVDGSDDNIRPWLDGFVQRHGRERAEDLLQWAGLPRNYHQLNDTAWTLMESRLDQILSTNVTDANDNKLVAFDAWVREKYKQVTDYDESYRQKSRRRQLKV